MPARRASTCSRTATSRRLPAGWSATATPARTTAARRTGTATRRSATTPSRRGSSTARRSAETRPAVTAERPAASAGRSRVRLYRPAPVRYGHRDELRLPRLLRPTARGGPHPPAPGPVRRARLPRPHRGADPAGRARGLEPLDRRDGRRPAPLVVGGLPPALPRGDPVRHPLRDEVVEARHELPRRLA